MGRKKEIITWNEDTIWTTQDKNIWRKSKEWIQFRNNLIKEKGYCELCGYEKRLLVHHIYQSNKAIDYTNLDLIRFKVVDSRCHKFLHGVFSSYKRKKDPIKPDIRLENILNEFLINH